jgi:hypothetical protein
MFKYKIPKWNNVSMLVFTICNFIASQLLWAMCLYVELT